MALNTIANWSYQAWNLLVVLILTPFLVRELDPEGFGLYSIARDSHTYLALFILGMGAAGNRFFSAAIERGDTEELNRLASTLRSAYLVLAIPATGLAIVLGLAAPALFDVPEPIALDTLILFVCVGGMLPIQFQTLVHINVLIGHQRFDRTNLALILAEAGRFGLIIALFSIGFNNLAALGLAMLSAQVVAYVVMRWMTRITEPALHPQFERADWSTFRAIFSFSAWSGIIHVGNVMVAASPTIIIGATLGSELVVLFWAPFMIWIKVQTLVAGLAATLTPIAAKSLVNQDQALLSRLLVQGCRTAAMMAFPIGCVFAILADPFFHWWLGGELGASYRDCVQVFAILMIGMLGRISQVPTQQVLIGGGSIRGLAAARLTTAVAALSLMIASTYFTDWHVVGVAWAIVIPLLLSDTVAIPILAARQAGLPLQRFYRDIYVGPVLSTIPGVALAALLTYLRTPDNFVLLVVYGGVSFGVSMATAWFTCVDEALRNTIRAKLPLLKRLPI